MVLEVLLSSLALIALAVASIFDLKTREVPDWLSFGLIIAAISIRAAAAIQLGWAVLLAGLIGLAAAVITGYILYFTRLWGGGDSKLLMGMGAAIGIAFPFSIASFQLLGYFLLLMLLGAFYGVVWMGFLALQHRAPFVREWKHLLQDYNSVQIGALIAAGVLLVPVFFLPLLWPLALFPPAVFYLFTFVSVVEKTCFLKKVSPARLTEGDWLADAVRIKGKELLKPKTLTGEDIKVLQALQKRSQLLKVMIREGVPFVPSFLLSYLLLLFGKGWLLKAIGFLL